MSFREQADKCVQTVAEALGATPTPEQAKAAADMIERAIIDSYRDGAAPRSPRIATPRTRTWRRFWNSRVVLKARPENTR